MAAARTEELIEESQRQMLFGNYDKALGIMSKLSEMEPENVDVLDVSDDPK